MIESSSNQQIKYMQRLLKAVVSAKERVFLAEGWKMVSEAIDRDMMERLYVSEEHEEEAKERWMDKAVRFETVAAKVFEQICDTMSPQGVLAVVRMPEYSFDEYIKKENTRFLCLEDINDPGNLGTMMRTAEGAGMTGLILSKGTVDLFNPKVVRSTMGALFRVPFFYTDNFVDTMKTLQKEGTTLYAAHLDGSIPYDEEDYQGAVGILIGNEANGLSAEVTEAADRKVRIPMEGQLESLNAAVSAALLMYEVARKRR